MKIKIFISLLVLGFFSVSTFAYNFSDLHKKVENYLQVKAQKNPTYARYYQQLEKQLSVYADQIQAGNNKVVKDYISGVLATKLISNVQNGKYKRLKAKNSLEKKVLQSAFDQGNYVTIGIKTNLSKDDLENTLSKYLPKFQIISFNDGVYLLKLPKNNPFAQIFLEQVQNGFVPDLDFLSANVVEPKILKKTGEYSLWNMTKIEADQIQSNLDNSGRTVTIAVLDTGIDPNHQDLNNAIWHNTKEIAGNGIDDDGNGYVDDTWGWDFGDNDNDPAPGDAHGTHVAGIIAAQVNGLGVYGADSVAKLMAVKIFVGNDGYTDSYRFSEGIHYAVDNGAQVINSSLGGDGTDDFEQSALDYAESHNVIVVVAAGNENKDASNTYPCADEDTICVGATDQNDNRAYFSNYGSKVDIAAPGVSILSTIPNNQYAYYDGTSMAAPHVTAVVGIIKMYKPTATLSEVKDILKKDSLPGPVDLGGAIVDAKKVYEDVADVEDNQDVDDILGDVFDDNNENTSTSDENTSEETQPVDNNTEEQPVETTQPDESNDTEDQSNDVTDQQPVESTQPSDTTKPFVRANIIARAGMDNGYLTIRAYDPESKITYLKVEFNGQIVLETNPNSNRFFKIVHVNFVNGTNTLKFYAKNEVGLEIEDEITTEISFQNTTQTTTKPVIQKPRFKNKPRFQTTSSLNVKRGFKRK